MVCTGEHSPDGPIHAQREDLRFWASEGQTIFKGSIYREPAFLVANTRSQKFCSTPIYPAPEVAVHDAFPAPDGYSNVGTLFDANPPNTGAVGARYEYDVSEQAERFIRALLASSPTKRMPLTSALDHPWIATETEDKGAPRALPTTPPALHTHPPLFPFCRGRPADGPAKAARDGVAAPHGRRSCRGGLVHVPRRPEPHPRRVPAVA
ncbi:uncharacterized protein BXZ73DRAFT_110419 [Epithele typhae]|uniref:uncharacterized protein n=1 Tax=Epithele typhae TaxID=378194 RepID=UPI0020088C55|nr:uncharacterized protein BXZ73DRAFT_110419 [Epithele typhae]KAH9907101.1 hypothetical protein BXZ73DRAFT_110419 [Epithele typhae]